MALARKSGWELPEGVTRSDLSLMDAFSVLKTRFVTLVCGDLA